MIGYLNCSELVNLDFLWGLFTNPLLHAFEISFTIVGYWSVIFSVEDKSWVSSNVDTFGLVNGSIKFSNDNIISGLEGITEFFPDWGNLLAVSAPWSIVLDENSLVGVHNNALEGFSNNNGNKSIVRFWNWLGLEVELGLSILNVSNPLLDLVN